MWAKRKILMISWRGGSWRGSLLLPCSLLALACGGKDGPGGRAMGDSNLLTPTAPLVDCAAEAAIASSDRLFLPNSEFETRLTGWGVSMDGSPMPITAPRPIINTCPQDSRYDCCTFNESQVQNPLLSPKEAAQQLEYERALEATYVCDLRGKDAPFVSALGGSSETQTIDIPAICNSKTQHNGKAYFGFGACRDVTTACQEPLGGAFHVRAARFTDWGAQITRNFDNVPGSEQLANVKDKTFDASKYDGISFWIRLGQGGSGAQPVGHTLFVAFDDQFTKENQPAYELNLKGCTKEAFKLIEECAAALLASVDCSYVPSEDCYVRDAKGRKLLDYMLEPTTGKPVRAKMADGTDAFNCYDVGVDPLKCDRYGAGVGLEPEWRFVKIPFTQAQQRGYGKKSPAGRLMIEALMGFAVYMDVGNWDFWIDEVAFYRDPPEN